MDMRIFSTIVNTILLVILFFYQKNKNKVLLDRIQQQEKLLNETKGIVSQQSTAIESQGKVVDTALKYSQIFDPKKIESIVRKELEIDHKAELAHLRSSYERQMRTSKSNAALFDPLAEIFKKSFLVLFSDLATPALLAFVEILYTLSSEERDRVIHEMPDGKSKDLIITIIKKVDEMLSEKGTKQN